MGIRDMGAVLIQANCKSQLDHGEASGKKGDKLHRCCWVIASYTPVYKSS
jgi:hypothetical protein